MWISVLKYIYMCMSWNRSSKFKNCHIIRSVYASPSHKNEHHRKQKVCICHHLTNWLWAFSTVQADWTVGTRRSQLLTCPSLAVTNWEQPWWGFHLPVVKRGWPFPSRIPDCITCNRTILIKLQTNTPFR